MAGGHFDYRSLLVRYIRHVEDNEGVTFLAHWYYSELFTEEEWEEMKILAAEAVRRA